MQCPLLEDLLKLLDETQSHRKEPYVISSNTVITSCEKGRKWFLSSVLWIDAKFVGVMESLRARLFTASCASISLVPFRLHFVFTTFTSSGTILTSLHRLSDEVWYHFDFTSSSLPSPILQPVDTIVIKLGTISISLHPHCRHQFWNHFDFTSSS